MKKQKKEKPPKHRLRRTAMGPGEQDVHIAQCGFKITGPWESREVRAVMTISGRVTCQNCMKV